MCQFGLTIAHKLYYFTAICLICNTFALSAEAQDSSAKTDLDRAQTMIEELNHRVGDLEIEINNMRQSQSDDWLTAQRADEIRSLVHDVIADADLRANLSQNGMTAGWDKGFFLSSADGNFMLKLSGQIQSRYVYNNQDNSPDDDDRAGFEMRRTKLNFKGNVIDPSIIYAIQLSASSNGGGLSVTTASIAKDFGNGWILRGGQFKPPFLREELISSSRQLAADRSLVNEVFNQDRAQGVELAYSNEHFKAAFMFHDGFNSDNTQALDELTEFAFTARAEHLVAGNWGQFNDFTSFNGEEFALLIGAAIHVEADEYGTGDGVFVDADADGIDDTLNDGEVQTTAFTLDASAKFGGANAFAAFIYRNLDSRSSDIDQYAFVVQGGVFVTDDWEAFARYEWSDFDTAGTSDLSVITIGVNRYFSSHSLKWTTDIGFGINEVSSAFSSDGTGWRTDTAGEDSQMVIRSQMQLLF